MTEKIKTADLFKGNPYLELHGEMIDQVVYGVETVTPQVEAIIRMAELHEMRTANMLAFQDGDKRSTKNEFKDELRDRVAAEKPAARSGSTFI